MKIRADFLFTVVLFAAISTARADTVTMKNGDVYRGTIIDQIPAQYVQIKLKDDNEKRLQWLDIERVERDQVAQPQPTSTAAPTLMPTAVSPSPAVSPVPTPVPTVTASSPPAAVPVSEPATGYRGLLKFNTGVTFSNSDNATLNNSSGTSLGSANTTGSAELKLGMEIGYIADSIPFGIFLAVEWNHYADSAATNPAGNTEIGVFAIPKVLVRRGFVHPWAGVGLGALTTIYGVNSTSSGGVTATIASSTTDFGVSPRVGVDFDLGERFTVGVQLEYTTVSGSVPFTATQGSQSATGSLNYTLSWFAAGLSLGMRF